MFTACDLIVIDATEMLPATAASASQMASHVAMLGARLASTAAMIAVRPMTTWPQPETAVKVPARSIVDKLRELAGLDDERWEQLLNDPQPHPKLETFLRQSAAEGESPLDPSSL